ncbi:aleurain-like protease [Artemisia annua]|uniref:Aleurain-like protease n=1 Tax=Artemisia annua TaxID=35608 RepID=A0A2U1Q4S4_ARTAN|nr:aleurain-like protease [Artemisia annua]
MLLSVSLMLSTSPCVVRPLSVAFQVIANFRLYTGGVFTSDNCGSDPLIDIVESLHGGRQRLNGIATSLHRCIYHFS